MSRNLASHLSYFFGKSGFNQAIVFEDRVVPVTTRQDIALANDPGCLGIVCKAPKTVWEGLIWFAGAEVRCKGEATEEAAVAVLRAKSKALHIEAVLKLAQGPDVALEQALKAYDWTAGHSDDYRVRVAAESQWARIQTLLRQVPADLGAALMAKYRPEA